MAGVLCKAKLIPNRGAWLEFESSNRDVLSVKVDRKRKLPVTILLRAIGFDDNEQLERCCSWRSIPTRTTKYISSTLEREPTKHQGRGAGRAVPAASARRSANAGERLEPVEKPVLRGTAL